MFLLTSPLEPERAGIIARTLCLLNLGLFTGIEVWAHSTVLADAQICRHCFAFPMEEAYPPLHCIASYELKVGRLQLVTPLFWLFYCLWTAVMRS